MPPTAEVLQDSAAAWASEGRGVPTPRGLPRFYFKDQSFIGSTPHTSFFIRVEMLLRGLHILPTSTANLFEFRHSQVIREGKLWGGDFLGRGDRKAKHQRNLHSPVGFSS